MPSLFNFVSPDARRAASMRHRFVVRCQNLASEPWMTHRSDPDGRMNPAARTISNAGSSQLHFRRLGKDLPISIKRPIQLLLGGLARLPTSVTGATDTSTMARVVKRYANRKLYDTTTSRYVALDDIAALIRNGEEVEVTDNESGADLTAVTFAQIILEEERRHKDLRSLPLLRELVRYGGDAIAGVTSRGIEALGGMRESAERRVSEIVSESTVRPAIIDEVLSTSRRQIEDLQRRVDQGIRQSVERLKSYPGIGAEVERLEGRVRDIENRIRKLLAGENGKPEDDSPGEPADVPPARSSNED